MLRAFTPEDYARDLITFQHPTKKTIDPYSYYYNQMTKNRNWQDVLNPYKQGYKSYNPSRMQLLNAQRYMSYNNMVMRTKSYNRNKVNRNNPLVEKINKLSQILRGPVGMAGKAQECDCEGKKENSGSYRLQTLSSKLNKMRPETTETLSMVKQSDPLEEALLQQQPQQPQQGVFKSGVCPNKFTFGRCLIDCYQDSDCEGNKICVSRRIA